MKRHRQTLDELLAQLAPVDTSWSDPFAEAVILRLKRLPRKKTYTRADLAQLFAVEKLPEGMTPGEHFDASMTIVRLFLDLSKDEFGSALRKKLPGSAGVMRLRKDPGVFYEALEDLGILDRMAGMESDLKQLKQEHGL